MPSWVMPSLALAPLSLKLASESVPGLGGAKVTCVEALSLPKTANKGIA